MGDSTQDILNKLNEQTGKNVTAKDVFKLAKQVKPSTLQDEDQLKQLIKSVGAMAGCKVPQKTVNEIIKLVQSGAFQTGQMDEMIRKLTPQKK
jgi:predicted RND superfamily exporter protein